MSALTGPTLTPHIARTVLAFYGDPAGGPPSGDFVNHLLEAMSRADGDHTAALAAGFPGMAEAVRLYKHTSDGLDVLRALATETACRKCGGAIAEAPAGSRRDGWEHPFSCPS